MLTCLAPAFLRMLDAHGSRDPMRSCVSVEFAGPSVVPPPPVGSIPRRHLNDGAPALHGSLPVCRRDGARWSMEDEHTHRGLGSVVSARARLVSGRWRVRGTKLARRRRRRCT
ncbi:unnamed protein product [Ixodes pacificus]